MINYKEKVCKMDGCGVVFIPTTGNQKYCDGCKKKAKYNRDKTKWCDRNRKRYNFKEYTKECGICGKTFTTYYTSKKYCGAEECEIERVRRKNAATHKKRSKEEMIAKGRKYYKNNRIKVLKSKAERYRLKNPDAKDYIFGRVYKHDIEYIKEYVEARDYELVSEEYVNSKAPLTLKCPIGHTWTTTFHQFRDSGENVGARCFYCYILNNYTSKFELEVRDYISSIYSGEVIYNDRTRVLNKHTNKPLELDLYFPQCNKAIECNGEYWHSTDEAVERDRIKNEFCNRNNINLLTITDQEWLFGKGRCLISNFIVN